MRPNWRRCDAKTRKGELCMNKAQINKDGTLLCKQHAKKQSEQADKKQ